MVVCFSSTHPLFDSIFSVLVYLYRSVLSAFHRGFFAICRSVCLGLQDLSGSHGPYTYHNRWGPIVPIRPGCMIDPQFIPGIDIYVGVGIPIESEFSDHKENVTFPVREF